MESRGGKATILNRMAWKGRSGQVVLREVLKEAKGRAFQVDEPQGRGAGLVRGPAGRRAGTQGLTRGHGSVGQTHAQQAAPPAVLRAGGGRGRGSQEALRRSREVMTGHREESGER